MARRIRGRGKLSVYKPRKHGRKWRVAIRDSLTGEVSYQKYDSEKAAQRGFKRLKKEAKRFSLPTIGELLTAYRKYMLDKGNKPQSVKTTDFRLMAYFGDELYDTPVGVVELEDLEERYEYRRARVSADTARNEIAEAKTFFRFLIERGTLMSSPAEGLKPALSGKRKKGKKQLRPSEAKLFLDHCMAGAAKGDDACLACAMVLLLGLRASELVFRKVRDIDRLTCTLHIDDAKTEAGERVLEIPDVLWPLITEQMADKLPMAPLFPATGESGFHDRQWPCKQTKRICGILGLPKVTAHGLRGTHASLARQAGATSHLVSKQLGHSNTRVTDEHYVAPGTEEQVARRSALQVLTGGQND